MGFPESRNLLAQLADDLVQFGISARAARTALALCHFQLLNRRIKLHPRHRHFAHRRELAPELCLVARHPGEKLLLEIQSGVLVVVLVLVLGPQKPNGERNLSLIAAAAAQTPFTFTAGSSPPEIRATGFC